MKEIEVNTNMDAKKEENPTTTIQEKVPEKPSYTPSWWETAGYISIALILFLALVYLFFVFTMHKNNISLLVSDKDLPKSYLDDRRYRVIRLENNLEVILIHDSNSEKSALSLTVGAGSFSDPEGAPGLAHLIEHLILSGSYDYPRPSEFEDHLSSYYGSTNSFTEEEKTTFFFESNKHGFEKALHIFSRMIAKPLFDTNHIKKHLEVMEAEAMSNIDKDQWREHQLIRNLASSSHPFSRLSSGDVKKLKKTSPRYLMKEIRTFYNKFYTPHNMKLVVYSAFNIEKIEEMANNFFADIRTDSVDMRQLDRYGFIENDVRAYGFKELSQIAWYKKKPSYLTPVLDLIFTLEEVLSKDKVEVKPLSYITYLLKHTREGSLINYLTQKNLAEKIDIGVISSFKTFSQYAISIHLTEKGLKNYEEVYELTFAFLNKLRTNQDKYVNIDFYDEISRIAEKNFRFLMKDDPYLIENINKNLNSKLADYLASLSMNMFDYDPYEFLQNDFVHSNFNSTIIKSYVNSLIPENVLIILGSDSMPQQLKKYLYRPNGKGRKLIDNMKRDPFYHTLYINYKMPNPLIEKLLKTRREFSMRPRNKYISSLRELDTCWGTGDFETVKKLHVQSLHNEEVLQKCKLENEEYKPKLLLNTEKLKMWYKQDRTYLAPKVNLYMNIITQNLRDDRKKYVFLNIYFEYLKSIVDTKLNEARDAGNEIKLEFNENGISIQINSFTDILRKILDKLAKFLFNIDYFKTHISSEVYAEMLVIVKEKMINLYNKSPSDRFYQIFTKITKKGFTSVDEVISELKNKNIIYSYNEFLKVFPQIQKDFFVTSLFYGSINYDQFKEMKNIFKKYIKIRSKNMKAEIFKKSALMNRLHSHNLIDGSFVYKRLTSNLGNKKMNYISNYFQVGVRSVKSDLLSNFVELLWGNLFNYHIKNLKKIGNVITAKRLEIDNIIV